jgi:hypothetical protein
MFLPPRPLPPHFGQPHALYCLSRFSLIPNVFFASLVAMTLVFTITNVIHPLFVTIVASSGQKGRSFVITICPQLHAPLTFKIYWLMDGRYWDLTKARMIFQPSTRLLHFQRKNGLRYLSQILASTRICSKREDKTVIQWD